MYGEVEEEGGIETGFVVCAVQLKHIIRTCDRIARHCWWVWKGGKSANRWEYGQKSVHNIHANHQMS